jgi:hypothetical protein
MPLVLTVIAHANLFWGGILGSLLAGFFLYSGLWPGDYVRGIRVSKMGQRVIYIPMGVLLLYFGLRDIIHGFRR